MPPASSIPAETHPTVRTLIHRMYLDAQYRGAACSDLARIAAGQAPRDAGLTERDADPAIPFLVACLRDDSWAWKPSIWLPYTGTQVGDEAEDALKCIGQPAIPALLEAVRHPHPKVRGRAATALARITALRLRTEDQAQIRREDRRQGPSAEFSCAVDSLVTLTKDPDRFAREAATRGLFLLADPNNLRRIAMPEELTGLLVRFLEESQDAPAQRRAAIILTKLTGQDFGTDVRRWRAWHNGKRPVRPDPEQSANRGMH